MKAELAKRKEEFLHEYRWCVSISCVLTCFKFAFSITFLLCGSLANIRRIYLPKLRTVIKLTSL